jgi:hypothetical protein
MNQRRIQANFWILSSLLRKSFIEEFVIVFELKNKMPQNCEAYRRSEDVLTGIVFGHLRYFSSQKLLRTFLNEAVSLDNKHPDLKAGNDFEITFWERNPSETNQYDEPDLHLKNDVYDIIIECKYYAKLGENEADKDSEYYTNQLIRYSNAIKDSAKEKLMIFLTNDLVRPNEEMENSKTKLEQHGIGLYWLSWNRLYCCMKQMSCQDLPDNEKLLFQDLLSFLEKRGMITFYGIRKPEACTLNWYYNLNALVNGGIEMAHNEIAQLAAAHNKLWEDLRALYGDIHRIICDEYKWECLEDKVPVFENAVSFSYFSGTKVLYFVVDANEGELQLALCSLSSKASIDYEWLNENAWKSKDSYPFDVYKDGEKKPEKLSSSSCFDVFITEDGDWLYCKIDLMSLDSTDKVNKDVKELLDVMINGKAKDFDPKSSALTFV